MNRSRDVLFTGVPVWNKTLSTTLILFTCLLVLGKKNFGRLPKGGSPPRRSASDSLCTYWTQALGVESSIPPFSRKTAAITLALPPAGVLCSITKSRVRYGCTPTWTYKLNTAINSSFTELVRVKKLKKIRHSHSPLNQSLQCSYRPQILNVAITMAL